jgi:hypothetical protein
MDGVIRQFRIGEEIEERKMLEKRTHAAKSFSPAFGGIS